MTDTNECLMMEWNPNEQIAEALGAAYAAILDGDEDGAEMYIAEARDWCADEVEIKRTVRDARAQRRELESLGIC